MRRSSIGFRGRSAAKAVGAALLGALMTVGMASDARPAKRVSLENGEVFVRPANLFKLVSQSDPALCKPIGISLNKPLRLPLDDNHPNITGDILLGSDLQVPWQRKLIGPIGNLDYADIDLANDGRPLAVYRNGILLFYKQSEDDLIVLRQRSDIWDRLTHSDTLEQLQESEAVERLAKQSIFRLYGPDERLIQDIRRLLMSRSKNGFAGDFVLNILALNGRTVVLLSGANESLRAWDGHPFLVFALVFHAGMKPSLVCELRGQS